MDLFLPVCIRSPSFVVFARLEHGELYKNRRTNRIRFPDTGATRICEHFTRFVNARAFRRNPTSMRQTKAKRFYAIRTLKFLLPITDVRVGSRR